MQFFGVRLSSVSLMVLRESLPACLVHATADTLDIEVTTLNGTSVGVSVWGGVVGLGTGRRGGGVGGGDEGKIC